MAMFPLCVAAQKAECWGKHLLLWLFQLNKHNFHMKPLQKCFGSGKLCTRNTMSRLEDVQHWTSGVIKGVERLIYEKRLKDLNLLSLANRQLSRGYGNCLQVLTGCKYQGWGRNAQIDIRKPEPLPVNKEEIEVDSHPEISDSWGLKTGIVSRDKVIKQTLGIFKCGMTF